MADLARRLTAEMLGTAFLLASVIGSGVMGERLAGGNTAIALLANTIATGMALIALVLTFSPISGAHFNPVVTLADAWRGGIGWRQVWWYIGAQTIGALSGVAVAHVMFGEPIYAISQNRRGGWALIFSEFVATFGLLAVIAGCSQWPPGKAPLAIAAYIMSAYWFTASTCFANPAVTLARTLSDTFAGISPLDAPGFLLAQLGGLTGATLLFRWLVPPQASVNPLTEVLNIVLNDEDKSRRPRRSSTDQIR